jgi:hypothetical protein
MLSFSPHIQYVSRAKHTWKAKSRFTESETNIGLNFGKHEMHGSTLARRQADRDLQQLTSSHDTLLD